MSAAVDLIPAALAQARELIAKWESSSDKEAFLTWILNVGERESLSIHIAAALGAVYDAARAEGDVRLAAAAELFRHIREAAGVAEPVDVAALPGIVENLARERGKRAGEVRQLRETLETAANVLEAHNLDPRIHASNVVADLRRLLAATEPSHG